MQIVDEIAAIERRLRSSHVPMVKVLTEAGINRSTWTRWRSGTTRPRLDLWLAAQSAVDKLAPQGAGA